MATAPHLYRILFYFLKRILIIFIARRAEILHHLVGCDRHRGGDSAARHRGVPRVPEDWPDPSQLAGRM